MTKSPKPGILETKSNDVSRHSRSSRFLAVRKLAKIRRVDLALVSFCVVLLTAEPKLTGQCGRQAVHDSAAELHSSREGISSETTRPGREAVQDWSVISEGNGTVLTLLIQQSSPTPPLKKLLPSSMTPMELEVKSSRKLYVPLLLFVSTRLANRCSLQLSASGAYGQSRVAYREVQDRHEDIKKIERTLEELAQLFNDVSLFNLELARIPISRLIRGSDERFGCSARRIDRLHSKYGPRY